MLAAPANSRQAEKTKRAGTPGRLIRGTLSTIKAPDVFLYLNPNALKKSQSVSMLDDRFRFHFVKARQFGLNLRNCFGRRSDTLICAVESLFVHRNVGEKLPPVKVVLREGRHPDSRRHFVAVLHKSAAFIDFGQ